APPDRRVIASFGGPGVTPGASGAALPIWRMLPSDATPDRAYAASGAFDDGGTPMVGAVQTLPDAGWYGVSWRPHASAYEALADMRRRGLVVVAAAALLAALVGLLAGRALTAPILAVVDQARLIGRGPWREGSPTATPSGEN